MEQPAYLPTTGGAECVRAEQVDFYGGGGGMEARYSCHWTYDTTTAPGDAVAQMMRSMAGCISRIGGE